MDLGVQPHCPKRLNMVIYIDEHVKKMHNRARKLTESARPFVPLSSKPDDDGPNDDPPAALRLVA